MIYLMEAETRAFKKRENHWHKAQVELDEEGGAFRAAFYAHFRMITYPAFTLRWRPGPNDDVFDMLFK